jgi:hypothetical protein
MRIPLVLTVFIATASTAHAECLSSAEAVWAAHPGSHAMWRLRMPGHIGEKCWYAPSESKEMQTDAPRNVVFETAPVSATAVPRPRPQLQDTLTETERPPLPARFDGRSQVDLDVGRTDEDRRHMGRIVCGAGASRRVTAAQTLRAICLELCKADAPRAGGQDTRHHPA